MKPTTIMALVTVEDLGSVKVVSTVRGSVKVIVLSGRLPGPDGYYRAVRIDDNGGGFLRVLFIRRGEVRSLSMHWLELLGNFATMPDVIPILWEYLRHQ
jgi:hypothetical protein